MRMEMEPAGEEFRQYKKNNSAWQQGRATEEKKTRADGWGAKGGGDEGGDLFK